MENKNIVENLYITLFQDLLIATVIKTGWYWQNDSHQSMEQNSIQKYSYTEMVFTDFFTEVPRQFNRERVMFTTNDAGATN